MHDLKPCPFCEGEAILCKIFKHGNGGCDLFTWEIECGDCGAKVPSCEDKAVRDDDGIRLIEDGRNGVIAAWNHRHEPADEPLTLDALQRMDGEPVWIVAHPDWGHWELSVDAEDYLDCRDPDFYGMKHNDPDGRYGLHLLGWLAYRHKPTQQNSPPG